MPTSAQSEPAVLRDVIPQGLSLMPLPGMAEQSIPPTAAVVSAPVLRLLIICADPHISVALRGSLRSSQVEVADVATDVTRALAGSYGGTLDVGLIVAPQGDGLPAMIQDLRQAGVVRTVMVLSPPDEISGVALVAALAAGADGWLSIDLPPAVLLRSIRGALRGEPGLSRHHVADLVAFLRQPATRHRTEAAGPLAVLTTREREILDALAGHGTVRTIARQLSLSEVTVRWYTSRLLRKLGLTSRADLVTPDAGRTCRPPQGR